MNFYEKIQSIRKMLPSKGIRDSVLLATGIYYKMRLKVSFRKIPLSGTSYSWSNFRYWLQKFKSEGKLQQLESIVGGEWKWEWFCWKSVNFVSRESSSESEEENLDTKKLCSLNKKSSRPSVTTTQKRKVKMKIWIFYENLWKNFNGIFCIIDIFNNKNVPF